MKIKLKNLKRIIVEALTKVEPQLSVIGKFPTKEYPDAVLIGPEDTKRIIQSLKVSLKYKTKLQYVWKESKAGLSDSIYSIGDLTNGNGDPFTYKKISGNKYRVISGPVPKTIGKVFNLSPEPAVPVDLKSESEDQSTPNSRKNSEPASILSMKLKEYAKKYLDPNKQEIFNKWNLLYANREKTLKEYASNHRELIKNEIRRLNEIAIEVIKNSNAISTFRAPAELLEYYAIDINDEDELNNSIDEISNYVGREILYSSELESELNSLQ